MGAWAAGLYSSDMAADMRATVKSVLRLPLDEDRIAADGAHRPHGRVDAARDQLLRAVPERAPD